MLGLMGVLTHVSKLKRKTPDVQQISDEARDDILWKTADKPSSLNIQNLSLCDYACRFVWVPSYCSFS